MVSEKKLPTLLLNLSQVKFHVLNCACKINRRISCLMRNKVTFSLFDKWGPGCFMAKQFDTLDLEIWYTHIACSVKDLMGLAWIRKKNDCLYSENCVTSVLSLRGVLQFSSIHLSRVELQYQAHPVDRCGALSEKKQTNICAHQLCTHTFVYIRPKVSKSIGIIHHNLNPHRDTAGGEQALGDLLPSSAFSSMCCVSHHLVSKNCDLNTLIKKKD